MLPYHFPPNPLIEMHDRYWENVIELGAEAFRIWLTWWLQQYQQMSSRLIFGDLDVVPVMFD